MRRKILIVEDNEDLLGMLRLAFKCAGFSIATAAHGIEALKKTRTLNPDVILLDLMLPELDGLAVCEIVRKDPATASIPIIMLTGISSELTRLAGLECGADAYVTKPIQPKVLVAKVKALLRPRKLAKAALLLPNAA
jgi:two-component system alkaline phosphatase synthesis response regulator PhoP